MKWSASNIQTETGIHFISFEPFICVEHEVTAYIAYSYQFSFDGRSFNEIKKKREAKLFGTRWMTLSKSFVKEKLNCWMQFAGILYNIFFLAVRTLCRTNSTQTASHALLSLRLSHQCALIHTIVQQISLGIYNRKLNIHTAAAAATECYTLCAKCARS